VAWRRQFRPRHHRDDCEAGTASGECRSVRPVPRSPRGGSAYAAWPNARATGDQPRLVWRNDLRGSARHL